MPITGSYGDTLFGDDPVSQAVSAYGQRVASQNASYANAPPAVLPTATAPMMPPTNANAGAEPLLKMLPAKDKGAVGAGLEDNSLTGKALEDMHKHSSEIMGDQQSVKWALESGDKNWIKATEDYLRSKNPDLRKGFLTNSLGHNVGRYYVNKLNPAAAQRYSQTEGIYLPDTPEYNAAQAMHFHLSNLKDNIAQGKQDMLAAQQRQQQRSIAEQPAYLNFANVSPQEEAAANPGWNYSPATGPGTLPSQQMMAPQQMQQPQMSSANPFEAPPLPTQQQQPAPFNVPFKIGDTNLRPDSLAALQRGVDPGQLVISDANVRRTAYLASQADPSKTEGQKAARDYLEAQVVHNAVVNGDRDALGMVATPGIYTAKHAAAQLSFEQGKWRGDAAQKAAQEAASLHGTPDEISKAQDALFRIGSNTFDPTKADKDEGYLTLMRLRARSGLGRDVTELAEQLKALQADKNADPNLVKHVSARLAQMIGQQELVQKGWQNGANGLWGQLGLPQQDAGVPLNGQGASPVRTPGLIERLLNRHVGGPVSNEELQQMYLQPPPPIPQGFPTDLFSQQQIQPYIHRNGR